LAGAAPWDLLDHRDVEHERDQAEAVRVAYVAATRARDLLVVPAIGDAPHAGWFEVLHSAVYPPAGSRRQPEVPPGCPKFGSDSVAERPPGAGGPAASVAPGLHGAQAGNAVVWWDPHSLKLAIDDVGGIDHYRILEADPDGSSAEGSLRNHAEWQARHAARRAAGSLTSIRTTTATDLAAEIAAAGVRSAAAPGSGTAVSVVRVRPEGAAERAGGVRFGQLVHATLAVIDLDATETGIRATVAAQARLLGCDDDELEAGVGVVQGALAHPLLRRAATCTRRGDVRREMPVLFRQGGEVIEGVVDLAFLEPGGGWTVVDFKTHRQAEGRLAEMQAQVSLYVHGVALATGLDVEGVLLLV
jgi:ATP-dependent exoDNAse (exonuclease V) beta subunit